MQRTLRPDAWWVPGLVHIVSGLAVLLTAIVVAIVVAAAGSYPTGILATFGFVVIGGAYASWGCWQLTRAARSV